MTQGKTIFGAVAGGAILAFALLGTAAPASASSETVLWSFKDQPDGSAPTSELTADPAHANTYYGTTSTGGKFGSGTVFELTGSGANWTVTILYNFNGNDGWHPLGGLAIDAQGNLYGTTQGGGNDGEGQVFELSPPAANGKPWTLKTIYNFQNLKDGGNPESAPVFDKKGNLYGTADWGGNQSQPNGVVWQLSPGGKKGGWKYTVLHAFNFNDGSQPAANVAIDDDGVVYGTTVYGGTLTSKHNGKSPGNGVVYALTPGKKGKWSYSILHTFSGLPTDGSNPAAPVTIGAKGVLFGTAKAGGTDCGGFGCGDAFSLTPGNSGAYTYKLLHHFTGGSDGSTPLAGLLLEGGSLFGTTSTGGAKGNGTVFQLSTNGGSFSTLHPFGAKPDGADSQAGLIDDGNGNLLGTTAEGGSKGVGTIFSVTP